MSLLPSDFASPETLAEALRIWALRREKVLAELDIRAARSARALARRCSELARADGAPLSGEDWEMEWRRVRDVARAMCVFGTLVAEPVPPLTEAPAPVPSYDGPTRVMRLVHADEDPPTMNIRIDPSALDRALADADSLRDVR